MPDALVMEPRPVSQAELDALIREDGGFPAHNGWGTSPTETFLEALRDHGYKIGKRSHSFRAKCPAHRFA